MFIQVDKFFPQYIFFKKLPGLRARLSLSGICPQAWCALKAFKPSNAIIREAYKLYISVSPQIYSCCFWPISILDNLFFSLLVIANHITCLSSNSTIVFLSVDNNHSTNICFTSVYAIGQRLNISWNNKYLFLIKFFVFHNIIIWKTPSLRPGHQSTIYHNIFSTRKISDFRPGD